MMTKLIVASLFLALAACANDSSSSSGGGGNGGEESPASAEARQKCADTPRNPGTDIRYVMSEQSNGQSCTTGCQIFTSGSSYCAGLLNDSLNNNCSRAAREESFQKDCR